MWTRWLATLSGDEPTIMLARPADPLAMSTVEHKLGLALPRELRSLLSESDGIADAAGAEPIWPVERIAEENITLREVGSTSALPAGADDDLVFFGEAADGILFAYELDDDDLITAPDIFAWHNDAGEALWLASDLESLLSGWARGELTL